MYCLCTVRARERSAREAREAVAALRASLAAAEAERSDAVARCAQQAIMVRVCSTFLYVGFAAPQFCFTIIRVA